MPLLIAPLSCLQAAYTSGRSENAWVKFGRKPFSSRSAAYISAVAPVASSSGTVSMKVISADPPPPLDRQPGAVGHLRRRLDLEHVLAERVAQLGQRDHLHEAAVGRLVGRDELGV